MPLRRWVVPLLLSVALAGLGLGCGRAETHSAPTPAATTATPTASPTDVRAYRFRLAANVTNAPGSPVSLSPTRGAAGVGSCAASALTPAEGITITLDGEVNGDRQQLRTCADIGFALIDSERVQIGSRVWSREGATPWREEQSVASGSSVAFGLDTAVMALMSGGMPRQILGKLQPIPDRVNEVDAFRYHLDPQQTSEILGSRPGGSPFSGYRGGAQLWVARWGHGRCA